MLLLCKDSEEWTPGSVKYRYRLAAAGVLSWQRQGFGKVLEEYQGFCGLSLNPLLIISKSLSCVQAFQARQADDALKAANVGRASDGTEQH